MSLKTVILEMEATAEAAVLDGHIVKVGATDDSALHAAAATDAILGVASHDAAVGKTVRVMYNGIAKVAAGGTIARGDLVTSGADGVAVVAAPGAGINNRILGIALESAVSGDLFRVLLKQGSVQG